MPIPNRPGNSSLRAIELGIGLALAFLIAGGFLAGGGRGRVAELGTVACAILLGLLAAAPEDDERGGANRSGAAPASGRRGR